MAPRHVAFVGGRWALEALERCARFGFEGPMWLVNPRLPETEHGEVFASVTDLPEGPDAVYLAVSSDRTVDAVRQLAGHGTGGCVCFAAGFSEKGGAGVAMEAELVRAAGDMALVGPNCYGMLDCRTGMHLWTGEVLERLEGPGIGIVSQSGALAEFLGMAPRSAPFAFMISVGNQAAVAAEEFAEVLIDDPGINAIGIYIEGIRDVARFSRMAARAAEKRKPVVVIKVGRSEKAAEVARGHTSSLAGTPALYDALFERLGVVRVDTLSQFVESLKLLSILGPLPGRRLAAMTGSGGEAAMIADYAKQVGVELPALSDTQSATLNAGLPDLVNVMNPLDLTVVVIVDPDLMALCFDTVAAGDFDVVAAMTESYDAPDAPFMETMQNMLTLFCRAVRKHGVAGIVGGIFPETLPERMRTPAIAAGVAPMQGLEEMVYAIDVAARFGELYRALDANSYPNVALPEPVPQSGNLHALDEWESKQWLSRAGVRTPNGRAVAPDEVAAAARSVGFPVALKVLDSKLLHKTEAGAVVLGLGDEHEVITALADLVSRHRPERVLVEAMVEDVVAELIVGINYDETFGHALVIGAGGVLVELLDDAATLLLPTHRTAVANAPDSLRVQKLIAGFRGRAAGDREALIDAVLAVAEFATAQRHRLVELDVNPLMVLPSGRGVIAADALIRIRE